MRRYSRKLRSTPAVVLLFVILVFLLPYDNSLSPRAVVLNAVSALFERRWWLINKPGAYPVDFSQDVAVLVKSGVGTKERIPSWLKAHEHMELSDVLLIGDFATLPGQEYQYRDRQLPVHDVLGWMIGRGYLAGELEHPRLEKYYNLTRAVDRGDADAAREMSGSFGWELDAMKFLPGTELLYNRFPDKKWYIMADDDTYLIQPSYKRLIEHFNPNRKHYLGNPVGGEDCHFGHGGSSIIMSHRAVSHLISDSEYLALAHRESLDETWGDKRLAVSLNRQDIYINEEYATFFNGERPHTSKITKERLCTPVLSFHGLSSSSDMLSVSQSFEHATEQVLWVDLWNIPTSDDKNGNSPISKASASLFDNPIYETGHKNWDYVGRLDEWTQSVEDVTSIESCKRICREERSGFCMAWTWHSNDKKCHMSRWIIKGDSAEGKTSGLNVPAVKGLVGSCRP